MQTASTPSAMEPLMPPEGGTETVLIDKAVELIAKSERLKSKFNPILQSSLGDLVRSMNCYYSNFLEGHNTHPIDIERALKNDFSNDRQKRDLQLEAYAHIQLQKKIDEDDQLNTVTSPDYFLWLHNEFCSQLPDEMLWVENPVTGDRAHVTPGKFRSSDVIIGSHIPVSATAIPLFMDRFDQRYNPLHLSRTQQVIAAAASHHRFLWIHPFFDGNGRVARLYSHAYLRKIGVGSRLWSISRGLARRHIDYKALLMEADKPRQGNYDGRGALSLAGLNKFCIFFLESCIDQVEFMETLLAPSALLKRIERWTLNQIELNQLPPGAFSLLKEALITGEFSRGQAPALTQYKERQARTVLSALTNRGLLVSDNPKGPVRLAFTSEILEDWFPKLFLG